MEDGTVRASRNIVGRSIEVSIRAQEQAARAPVVCAIIAREAVQRSKHAFRSQLKNRARIVSAAQKRRSVNVSIRALHDRARRILPICAVRKRAEYIKRGHNIGRRDLEDRATSRAARTAVARRSFGVRRPIQVPVCALYQRARHSAAIRAIECLECGEILLRGRVNHRQSARNSTMRKTTVADRLSCPKP